MRRWLIKKYYNRRLLKAHKIFQSLYDRHRDAGHEVYMTQHPAPNFSFYCHNCPEYQPLKRKEKDKVVVYRDRFGRIIP